MATRRTLCAGVTRVSHRAGCRARDARVNVEGATRCRSCVKAGRSSDRCTAADNAQIARACAAESRVTARANEDAPAIRVLRVISCANVIERVRDRLETGSDPRAHRPAVNSSRPEAVQARCRRREVHVLHVLSPDEARRDHARETRSRCRACTTSSCNQTSAASPTGRSHRVSPC